MATADLDPLHGRRVNLYEVLQVSSRACPDVVQAAYRALARAYHPDINPSPDAARQMKQVNAAYGVLSDPVRRAKYDAVRARPMRARGDVVRTAEESSVSASARPSDAPSTGGSAAPRPTPRPSHIRAVPPGGMSSVPRSGGPRLGRLLGALAFVVLLICACVYGLWLVAGALEDEPTRAMVPDEAVTQVVDNSAPPAFQVPADILSSVLSQNDGTKPSFNRP